MPGATEVNTCPSANQRRPFSEDDCHKAGKHHRQADASSKPDAVKNPEPHGPKKGEAYWRGQAKQIRDEIESVDRQIKALNEKTQSGKGDGIKIGFETYNSVIYADFESQAKELEKQKEKLQKMMTALEEEARKAGALPGWLR